MANYVKSIPRDVGGAALQDYAGNVSVLATYARTNGSVSSVITVGEHTTAIEVAAIGAATALRFVPANDTAASVTGTNFAHVVPVNTVRRFVLPIETGGQSTGTSSVVGARDANGLYKRVANISLGVGSVLLTEY